MSVCRSAARERVVDNVNVIRGPLAGISRTENSVDWTEQGGLAEAVAGKGSIYQQQHNSFDNDNKCKCCRRERRRCKDEAVQITKMKMKNYITTVSYCPSP